MSLQVLTGPASLVAIGFSIGDVATLYGLGQKVGNWLTAASGDKDLLELLDEDETAILRRRGLIDIVKFNKIWGSKAELLTAQGPQTLSEDSAREILEPLPRFTVVMVYLVAALDVFTSPDTVAKILKSVLLELLQTSDYGEDVLLQRVPDRINAWRSTATLRGLCGKARQIRRRLIQEGYVLDGLMPRSESIITKEFLVWLLSDSSANFATPSSDVAGIGFCLAGLGFDVLAVNGLGIMDNSASKCTLEYSPECVMNQSIQLKGDKSLYFAERPAFTTVNLLFPEQSFSSFPVDSITRKRCNNAWIAGSEASKFVSWVPITTRGRYFFLKLFDKDLHYVFWGFGLPITSPDSVRPNIMKLLEGGRFFIPTAQFLQGLQNVLRGESEDTMKWLAVQICPGEEPSIYVSNPDFRDQPKINIFTIFQAYIMGYLYGLFLPFVDTSDLRIQMVDGAWGYRDLKFLHTLMKPRLPRNVPPKLADKNMEIDEISRERLISILAQLLICLDKPILKSGRDLRIRNSFCVGIVRRQTLVTKSILKPCTTIKDIGRFVLLDVDTSGIPTDLNGFIYPGEAEEEVIGYEDTFSNIGIQSNFGGDLNSHPEDMTFHIEADFNGDPRHMLLCARYKGRRVKTINPCYTDSKFCDAITPPWIHPNTSYVRETPMQWSLEKLLNKVDISREDKKLFVLHLPKLPRTMYAALTWYPNQSVCLSNGDLSLALKYASKTPRGWMSHSCLVITGNEVMNKRENWSPGVLRDDSLHF